MIRMLQTAYLARMNRLQAFQRELAHLENNDSYEKTLDIYKKYVDFIRTWNSPEALINAYIRFAQYCERMEDRLFATDLYSEALELMQKLGTVPEKESLLQSKIESLHYF